jgi:uncharacterized protein YbaP (TraB family)
MKEPRRRIIETIFVLACFIPRPLAAQATDAPTTERHSLWKVEGRSNAVFLLGSIHVLKAKDFPLAAPLEAAFNNAQVAVFETDLEEMADRKVQERLASKAKLPEGETLKQRLPAGTYAALASHAKEVGLPMKSLESLKPPMAAIALTLEALTKMGADPKKGLDQYFYGRARKGGKPVIGLESVDFQIDLATGFSPEEEDLAVSKSLEDLDKLEEKYGEMVGAWRTGDSAAIENLLNDALRGAPSLYKKLVTDRNKRWIPKIEELLRGEQSAIVIAGVGHLAGGEGVVELLKKNGWKITQL